MAIEDDFPIWGKLTASQQETLRRAASRRSAPKGTLLHSGADDCVGLLLVRSGQIRAFILSSEGKEVTLYRLFGRDLCLFSASCILSKIQFDISVEAEKDSEFWVIPADVYQELMEQSAAVSNYTNELMAARFSEVMWLIEQVMFHSFDKRLAAFLLTESGIDRSDTLKITHERVAGHLGTAREVVTRMLKYFQSEGVVSLGRGEIKIIDRQRLAQLAQ